MGRLERDAVSSYDNWKATDPRDSERCYRCDQRPCQCDEIIEEEIMSGYPSVVPRVRVGSIVIAPGRDLVGVLRICKSHTPLDTIVIERADCYDLLVALMTALGIEPDIIALVSLKTT